MAKEHKTKRRHESVASVSECPLTVNPLAQRLKDLSEIDDDDNKGLVRVALQKQKIVALDAPAPKKAKKAQLVAKPCVTVLPLYIP